MASDTSPILDNLPAEIKFLAEPVRRYHVKNGASAIEQVKSTLSPEELEELRAIGRRVLKGRYFGNHISSFLDTYDLADYDEAALLYFFFGLLDEIGIEFEQLDDSADQS